MRCWLLLLLLYIANAFVRIRIAFEYVHVRFVTQNSHIKWFLSMRSCGRAENIFVSQLCQEGESELCVIRIAFYFWLCMSYFQLRTIQKKMNICKSHFCTHTHTGFKDRVTSVECLAERLFSRISYAHMSRKTRKRHRLFWSGSVASCSERGRAKTKNRWLWFIVVRSCTNLYIRVAHFHCAENVYLNRTQLARKCWCVQCGFVFFNGISCCRIDTIIHSSAIIIMP